MYIHNTTHKILYVKDFTHNRTHQLYMHHITQHIILSKCSPAITTHDTHHSPKLPHTAVRRWPVVDEISDELHQVTTGLIQTTTPPPQKEQTSTTTELTRSISRNRNEHLNLPH